MKIKITLDLYDEAADPDHETGVTDMTFVRFTDFFAGYGEDLEIMKADDE